MRSHLRQTVKQKAQCSQMMKRTIVHPRTKGPKRRIHPLRYFHTVKTPPSMTFLDSSAGIFNWTSTSLWSKLTKYTSSCFMETKELKEMQTSLWFAEILATFPYGENKTSVGDAVGKDSLQIWAGWMEAQPAAEISTCGKLSLLPPKSFPWLGVREQSCVVWPAAAIPSAGLSCLWGLSPKSGLLCSGHGKVQLLQLLPELSSGLPKEAELSMPCLRALAVQLMTALL